MYIVMYVHVYIIQVRLIREGMGEREGEIDRERERESL